MPTTWRPTGSALGDHRTGRGGLADRASFEHGDALAYAAALGADDRFDLVVLDHDTSDYVAGFDTVRDLVAPGGAVLVDNVAVYGAVLTPDGLVATLDGGDAPNERTRAVAAFLRNVREDEGFEVTLLPVGGGLAVCTRL